MREKERDRPEEACSTSQQVSIHSSHREQEAAEAVEVEEDESEAEVEGTEAEAELLEDTVVAVAEVEHGDRTSFVRMG